MNVNAPSLELISTTAALEAACADFAGCPYIAVDTEFMRETTFWPKLCLIQISGDAGNALIDPLAPGIELDAFYRLMADTKVTKVFHAARQDIEIIFIQAGIIPTPLFDSQIAAMVCGFGDSVGYENLIRTLLNVTMDKSSRFTDWSRRPLSQKQLSYALADVTHLLAAYPKLKNQLERTKRTHWLIEEMAILENPATYKIEPEDAWKRVKFNANSKRARAILMEVAAWRERQAHKYDVPRNRILKDDAIREIALQRPQSTQDLDGLRAVPKGFGRSSRADGLLDAVTRGMDKPDQDIFEPVNNNAQRGKLGPTTEMLKVLLKVICTRHDVAPKLIASSADLERIAGEKSPDVPALTGWRYELFGAKAQALKGGKISLGLKNGKPVLIEQE